MAIEKVKKSELLEHIKRTRQELEQALAGLTDEQMLAPVFDEGWTVKDTLAHIVTWEQRMVRWVGMALKDGVPGDIPSTDEEVNRMNQQAYLDDKDLPLATVRTAFARSYPQAYTMAETAPEAPLLEADYFEWRQGRALWYVVAANTWWHYEEHIGLIVAAFEQSEDQ